MRENSPGVVAGRLAALILMLGPLAAIGGEKTEPAPSADKTLVAWAAPANLTQRGGSVLTIEKPGGTFDAVVFGEMAPSKWKAGSNGFARTQRDQAGSPAETADAQTLVQIAVVSKGRQVTLYRNGRKYAEYRVAEAEQFGSDSLVLIGLRHVDANPDGRFFTGSIADARIYGAALDAHQIAALQPNQPSAMKPRRGGISRTAGPRTG
jgi:beta-fructofuranosidase